MARTPSEPQQETAHDALRRQQKTINTAAKMLEVISVQISERLNQTSKPVGWQDLGISSQAAELAAQIIEGLDR